MLLTLSLLEVIFVVLFQRRAKLSTYLIKVGEDTAADRPKPAVPGTKKVYGSLVGRVASDLSTFLMSFGDLLLIAFAAAAPESCQFFD